MYWKIYWASAELIFLSSSKYKCFCPKNKLQCYQIKEYLWMCHLDANIQAPDLEWTELEALRFSLPVSCCQCNYSYFVFILPMLSLHTLWRKKEDWKNESWGAKERQLIQTGDPFFSRISDIHSGFWAGGGGSISQCQFYSQQTSNNPQRTFRNHLFK